MSWPLPQFHFLVEWNGTAISFQEVSGLDVEEGPVEYRHGDSPTFSAFSLPGTRKSGNVILSRGVVVNDIGMRRWLEQIRTNVIERVDITISLVEEAGAPTLVWTLRNAWPTRITGTDLKSGGNGVAVGTLEIAHEGIAIESRG